MTPERWQCVNELYHEAQACASSERDAFLRARCAGDEELYLEVTSLLAADEKAVDYLVTPALELEAKALAAEQETALPMRQLAHYEILAPLGAGGMGEVWRARDTRLGRQVALKTLPLQYTLQSERVQRFRREAQTASALNHPNILTVYDIGQVTSPTGELHFIATELLEGTELRALLPPQAASALPLRTALDYARQIAAGLAAAHEKGIVHRDLKPENLFVTHDGRVKILDFGLAKLKPKNFFAEGEAQLSGQPRREGLTGAGMIMGTVGYMSPEQVRGEEVDQRSDLFSFGLILYEMLAGQRAFQRASLAETMAAILSEEPPELCELNNQVSPELENIVRHCLEKKPEMRFQSARDLSFALEALSTPSGTRWEKAAALPVVAARAWNQRLAWVVAAAFLLGVLGFAFAYFRRASVEKRLTYSYLPLPERTVSFDISGAALSPDGQRVVLVAVTEGVNRLWVYRFDQAMPELLPGTEEARYPFWSPDGRSIGFFAQTSLKRIEASGGSLPISLCSVPLGAGGAWSKSGVILFAPQFNGAGLAQVADMGGSPTPVTRLDASRFETGHNFPSFLPDGHHFIFFTQAGQPEFRGIRVGSLDEQQTRFLTRADTKAEYSTAGYLLLMQGRRILAQPFDSATLTLNGEPVPVTEPVYYEAPFRYADLTVSGDQTLIYRRGGTQNGQLRWYDRSGKPLAAVGPPGDYRSLQLSPDRQQVLLDRNDPQLETSDIWQFDLQRETQTRLTFNPGTDTYPIWSPDGGHVAFASNRAGFWGIYRARGDGREELLLKGDQQLLLTSDWSSDGQFIVYRRAQEKTRLDLEVLPLFGDRQPRPYLAMPFDESYGNVSPDGRWLAYQSNNSGHYEIFVQSFPEPGRQIPISKGDGMLPRWRRDGRELYYVGLDDKLMAVPVTTGTSFAAGTPVPLFEVGSFGRRLNRYVYDVSADGQKFLVIRPLEDASLRPLTVIQNWTALLKK
ncbi:MAG TPA: protein kinase [Blastocatellia bacterium]|nr:protein kinase [Blastocatellia bacterium]